MGLFFFGTGFLLTFVGVISGKVLQSDPEGRPKWEQFSSLNLPPEVTYSYFGAVGVQRRPKDVPRPPREPKRHQNETKMTPNRHVLGGGSDAMRDKLTEALDTRQSP